MYCDTDSIIYKNGEVDIPIGDNLGDWTCELKGDVISEFLATAPKCYSYKTKGGKDTTKVKGITLNYENSELINFESMKQIIDGEYSNKRGHITVVNEGKLTIDKKNSTIVNKYVEKTFSINFDKRNIVKSEDLMDTFPYGY
jgi:hypothetical protein